MNFMILKLLIKVVLRIGFIVSFILPFRIRGYLTILLLAVTYYVTTSFTAIIQKNVGDGSLYFTIVALVFLLIEIGSEALITGVKAQKANDFDLYRMFKVRSWFVFLSALYFIYLQFDLSPAQNNDIALYFVEFLTMMNSIPIFGLILVISAPIYTAWMIIRAFNALRFFNARRA